MRCKSDFLDVEESVKNCGDISILSPEKTRELLKKSKTGDKNSRDILVRKNMSIVLKLAKKHYIPTVDLSDLVSAGIAGLIKAIDNFDLSYNNGFLTYASYIINDEINLAVKNTSRTMHITFAEHKNLKKAYAINKRLTDEGITKKSERYIKIAYELGISEEKVISLFRSSEIPESYDTPISTVEEDCPTMLSLIADVKYESPEDSAIKAATILKTNSAVSRLPKKQQQIIKMRFGLGGKKPMTCSEIAEIMECSKAWVNQLEHKALESLKNFREIKELA